MKTTVEIPDPLLAEVRRIAGRESTTVRALIAEGLRQVLAGRQSRRSFALRQVTFGAGDERTPAKDWQAIRDLIYDGRGG
jgi:hypothetical protein